MRTTTLAKWRSALWPLSNQSSRSPSTNCGRELGRQIGYAAVMRHRLADLVLRLGFRGEDRSAKNPLCDAVARMMCVGAVYERKHTCLAPHVVYGSRDNLFVDAVVIEQNGERPDRADLVTFAISDLKHIVVSGPHFSVHPSFDPGDMKYSAKIVCIVEMTCG